MAGSGGRRMTINTRERAVSNDHNRGWAFNSAAIAELYRHVFDVRSSENNSGGTELLGSAVTTPLRGVILSGLRARPEIGTVNLFIEPGAALIVDPTGDDSDDCVLKYVVSDGVQTAGELTLTAGGGGTRIDVIE